MPHHSSPGKGHRAALRTVLCDRCWAVEGCLVPFQLPKLLLFPSSPSQALGGLGSSSDSFQIVDLQNSAIEFPLSKAKMLAKHLEEKSHRCYRPEWFHVRVAYFMHWQQELSMHLWNFRKSAAKAWIIYTLRSLVNFLCTLLCRCSFPMQPNLSKQRETPSSVLFSNLIASFWSTLLKIHI